jgi:diadenosine tetraphosphatase ApaH/serine/threonine PP2A family protein phosphatase
VPYLILSDIHANFEALQAVLADAEGWYERIYCLGDLVGYGADPNKICEWAKGTKCPVVRGNHDRACAGLDDLEDYNPAARASAIWTRRALTAPNRLFLERLPKGPVHIEDGALPFDLAHGSPADEDEYLIQTADVAGLDKLVTAQATFFGHTHLQGGFVLCEGGVKTFMGAGLLDLEPGGRYLMNPGSVGQPRDGDPRAAYALYSPEERAVEFCRVEYDIEAAANKIRVAGLPDVLAARLSRGM